MRVPRSNATEKLRQLVRLRSVTYEVTRQSGVENIGMGETRQTTEMVWRNAVLFSPSEDNAMEAFGDRLDGDINGVTLPDADIQVGDEFTHNGIPYEVTTVTGHPSDEDAQIQRLALDKITGER